MKTKLILMAVFALVGLTMLFAFKQSEEGKKYLHLGVGYQQIIVIDENSKIESAVNSERDYGSFLKQINLEMNNISKKGFKLVSSSQVLPLGATTRFNTVYVFEKIRIGAI
ncbi:MAG: hypothetical protein SGJ00_09275 [bacterium]|nr:hypothetical protein [bacterium]